MTVYNPYADMYYSYGFDTDSSQVLPYGGGGDGDYATIGDVNNAIDDAISGITVTPYDEDSTKIDIDGRESIIDDVYLTNVSRDDETNEAVFTMNNNRPPIRVDIDELDNPNIDCQTF